MEIFETMTEKEDTVIATSQDNIASMDYKLDVPFYESEFHSDFSNTKSHFTLQIKSEAKLSSRIPV